MRMEITEALITIVICGVLGAVIWERMGVTLWWLAVAVALVGVVVGILMVAEEKIVIYIQDVN